MDTPVLAVLLEHGANPNRATGPLPCASFLDEGVSDYHFEMGFDTVKDRSKEPSWTRMDDLLEYMDSLALKHGFRRPDHLYLLRFYGALTAHELDSQKPFP